MSEYLAKENIYNKNGILLLSKGQKVTNAVITKLKKFGNYKPEEQSHFDNIQSAALTMITQEFGVRVNIRDNRILEQPNTVLSTKL